MAKLVIKDLENIQEMDSNILANTTGGSGGSVSIVGPMFYLPNSVTGPIRKAFNIRQPRGYYKWTDE